MLSDQVRLAPTLQIRYGRCVKPETRVKLVVTVASVGLVVARIARPDLIIDATSLGFLLVAILPWLSSLFDSIQFPGGGGVTFRAAVERAKQSGDAIVSESPPPTQQNTASAGGTVAKQRVPLTATDPNLAFVALRIDLERALTDIAQRHDISGRTIRELVQRLVQQRVLPPSVGRSVRNLIDVGNQAAHGKPIDRDAGAWAQDSGAEILAALERFGAETR